MLIKGIIDECMGDFKEIGMLIIFPNCTFKCDKENGSTICQNSHLAQEEAINYPLSSIIQRYLENPIPQALICGGLEPLDSFHDLYELINQFREVTDDPIVIYTGYTEDEANNIRGFEELKWLGNIYIKYGRFKPNSVPHFDEVLGVNLASTNQYARYYE